MTSSVCLLLCLSCLCVSWGRLRCCRPARVQHTLLFLDHSCFRRSCTHTYTCTLIHTHTFLLSFKVLFLALPSVAHLPFSLSSFSLVFCLLRAALFTHTHTRTHTHPPSKLLLTLLFAPPPRCSVLTAPALAPTQLWRDGGPGRSSRRGRL